MHKIVKAVTVGSVGDLGRIARALADNGYNIAAIGGGEGHARGSEVGIISLAIEDDDADDGQIADVIRGVDLGGGRRLEAVEEHPALIVELPNTPGQLAAVAEEIGSHDINIMGVLGGRPRSGRSRGRASMRARRTRSAEARPRVRRAGCARRCESRPRERRVHRDRGPRPRGDDP